MTGQPEEEEQAHVSSEALASNLLKKEAAHQMSVRHGRGRWWCVAAASIEKMLEGTASTSEMVRLQRQLIEFGMCSQAAEVAFLDVMVRMSDDLKQAHDSLALSFLTTIAAAMCPLKNSVCVFKRWTRANHSVRVWMQRFFCSVCLTPTVRS